MKINKLLVAAFVSAVFFVSCTDDIDDGEIPLGNYDNGVLILNQGGFGKGNASVSYLSNDFVTQQNNIFSLVNPTITLGDVGQDIGLYQNLAFIILNGSNKIEVVNRYTMAHIATVSAGLDNPRYIAFANGKAFVTNWGDGGNTTDDYVAVLNLSTYSISAKIAVAEGPERMVENNNRLYVAHKGGWGYGKTVSIINITDNTLSTVLNVGDVPNSLEIYNGSLYVLCGGKPSYSGSETAGSFVKINLANNTVSSTINFPDKAHPEHLDIVDSNFYYTNGLDIYKSTLTTSTLPTVSLFSTNAQGVKSLYSFAVKNNKIYVGDSGDNNSNGKIYVYSMNGTLENSYTVGHIPAGFYFN